MNLEVFDTSKCRRKEKEVIAGLCLSFDLLREICLETGKPCESLMAQRPVPPENQLFVDDLL